MKVLTSRYRHTNLPLAVGWKLNHKPGICTVGGQLTRWPDDEPLPDDSTLEQWVAEWGALPIEQRDHRYKLKALIESATTIAELKVLLKKVCNVSNLP